MLGKPFFLSSKRWRAGAALAVVGVLLVALNALNVANSYVGRNFMTAIALRNRGEFVSYAGLYLVVFAASTAVAVTQQFVVDRLALSWRDWLTRSLLDRYLAARTFARINARKDIDNPDQRISEDVHTFTTTLLSFTVMIANATLTTVAFAGVLWSIAPVLLFTAAAYSVVGSVVTVALGYRLVALSNLQLKKEADLRHGLIHVRELERDADEGPDARTHRLLLGRLRRVVHNSRAIITVNRNVGFFTSGYNYLVPILPVLIVAPRYLRGGVELGVVTQSAMAFAQLLGAFSLIVAQFQSISSFTAVVRRLGSFREAMDGAELPHGSAMLGTPT
jgi:putative ATP-binding cassette transporter